MFIGHYWQNKEEGQDVDIVHRPNGMVVNLAVDIGCEMLAPICYEGQKIWRKSITASCPTKEVFLFTLYFFGAPFN